MFGHHRQPGVTAALLLFSLLILGGCGQNQIYVITDEPNGLAVGGTTLTSAEVETLASAEAEARARLLAGEYRQAAESYQKQLPLLAGHFIVQYKVAAAYAEAGMVDESVEWLDLSVKNGFANIGRMDTDPALEALHEDERAVSLYRSARENMIALRSRILLDPWTATPAADIPAFDNLASLAASFDEQERLLDRLDGVFFNREYALRRVMNHRARAEALEAFIAAGAGSPEDIEEARVEQLRVYRPHSQPPRLSAVAEARLDQGCRDYLADYPDGRFLAEVKLYQAEYQFLSGLRGLSGARREEIPALANDFRTTMAAIAVEWPGTTAAGMALAWTAALDFDSRFGSRDLAAATETYRTLESEYLEMPVVAEFAAQRLPALGLIGDQLPAFSVTGINGEEISSEAFRGNVLLLFFWSTTSRSASDEIANLKWIEEKFREPGVIVAGVSLDDADQLSRDEFAAWVEANNVPWPQYYDGRGTDNELARLCGVVGAPFVLIIDAEGTLVDAGLTGKDLELAVAAALE